MFNIEERAPLWLAGVLITVFSLMSFGPLGLAEFIRGSAILVPLQMEQVPASHHVVSVVASGFFHTSWTQVLVNVGMMVAFAVITLRGVRALAEDRGRPVNAGLVFLTVFLAGVVGGNLFQWGWWTAMNTPAAAALGASGGASALFATAGWALGGTNRLLKFGLAWALLNVIFVLAAPIFGGIAWPSNIGGYIVGAMLAPYLVKPFSTGFSITR